MVTNCRDQWNLHANFSFCLLLTEARREEGFQILDTIFGVSPLYHKSCKSFAAKFSNFNGYRNSASSGMNDYLSYSVSLSEETASKSGTHPKLWLAKHIEKTKIRKDFSRRQTWEIYQNIRIHISLWISSSSHSTKATRSNTWVTKWLMQDLTTKPTSMIGSTGNGAFYRVTVNTRMPRYLLKLLQCRN